MKTWISSFLLRPLVIAITAVPLVLEARTWTQDSTGRKIVADFVRLDQGNVVLRFKGRQVTVPLSSLSKADQEFVAANAGKGSNSSSTEGGWPRFRGPDQNNISRESGLMKSWPEGGPKKVWSIEQAGEGYSTIIVAGGVLYHNCTINGKLTAMAMDPESGKEIWKTTFGDDDGKGYGGMGAGPRSTPTYADGKLLVLSPLGKLVCLNAKDGSEVWSIDYRKDFSGSMGHWGYAESPVVDGNQVIISPGGAKDSIVALELATGKKIWGADLGVGSAEYTSMVGTEINGTKQYVKLFMDKVVGVDAKSGKKIWESDWRGATAVAAAPLVADNKVFITTGYGVGCKLVSVKGQSTNDEWDNKKMKNHHGGVVKLGDHIYGFSDSAGLVCQSWKTGEQAWNHKERFTTKGSLCVADGMLFCYNEDGGGVTLAEASPDGFKKLGQFEIEKLSGRKTWAYPVVVGGKLYVRDQNYLACFDVKK
jgi:outer membrane protein assembly factor BamB